MSATAVNDSTFQQTIQSERIVLVDFYGTSCGPCKLLAPTIDALAKQYAGRALIVKAEIEETQMAAAQYNVRTIPTLVLFKHGVVVNTLVGRKPSIVIEKMIEEVL